MNTEDILKKVNKYSVLTKTAFEALRFAPHEIPHIANRVPISHLPHLIESHPILESMHRVNPNMNVGEAVDNLLKQQRNPEAMAAARDLRFDSNNHAQQFQHGNFDNTPMNKVWRSFSSQAIERIGQTFGIDPVNCPFTIDELKRKAILERHPEIINDINAAKELFDAHAKDLKLSEPVRTELGVTPESPTPENPTPERGVSSSLTPAATPEPAVQVNKFAEFSKNFTERLSTGLDTSFFSFDERTSKIDLSESFKEENGWDNLTKSQKDSILKQLKDRCLSIDKNGQVTLTDEFKKFLKDNNISGRRLGTIEANFQDVHNTEMKIEKRQRIGEYVGKKLQTIKNNKIKSGFLAVSIVSSLLYLFSGNKVTSSNPDTQDAIDTAMRDAVGLPQLTNCLEFANKLNSLDKDLHELLTHYDSDSSSAYVINGVISINNDCITDAQKLGNAKAIESAATLKSYVAIMSDFNNKLKINIPKLQKMAELLASTDGNLSSKMEDVSNDMMNYVSAIESFKASQISE